MACKRYFSALPLLTYENVRSVPVLAKHHFRLISLSLLLIIGASVSGVVMAQEEVVEEAASVQVEAEIEVEVEDEPVTPEINTEMENKPYVRLRSLDKVTARTMTFDAQIGTTVTFGNLYIRVQTCRQSQPIEEPESAAFLQVWEDQVAKESQTAEDTSWVFSGWMFASSPGLSHMDHPVYDVWVMECLDAPSKDSEAAKAVEVAPSDATIDSASETPDVEKSTDPVE